MSAENKAPQNTYFPSATATPCCNDTPQHPPLLLQRNHSFSRQAQNNLCVPLNTNCSEKRLKQNSLVSKVLPGWFMRVRVTVKSDFYFMSVCLRGTTWLPLEGFS
jgi:hypothetical protein